jgi:predicted nucleotidyltransferase
LAVVVDNPHVERRFTLVADDAVLPRGTRVIIKVSAVDTTGVRHRPGVLVVVREHLSNTVYSVESIAGASFVAERSVLALEKPDHLAHLAQRQHDHARLAEHVVLAVVVVSHAWGLADASSDEDVRGCFVLPFDEASSIYDAPDEIHAGEIAYWEIEKLVRQGLRADPNTLETLWSPLVKLEKGVGARLRSERAIFSSLRVIEAFGRYAQSQLKKLERSLSRRRHLTILLHEVRAGKVTSVNAAQALLPKDEDVHALVRSLFDRGLLSSSSFGGLVDAVNAVGVERLLPEEVRPKNAYNLVRLLHSCAHWIKEGTPLIKVTGELRGELLAIKRGDLSIDETLKRAGVAAAVVDDLVKTGISPLPPEPDVDAADAIVRAARRDAARVVFAMADTVPDVWPADRLTTTFAPTPLPLDVDLPALRAFLEEKQKLLPGPFLVVGLTGAHAYGFPSPDSDLDLKAVHAAPARSLLGLTPSTNPLELVEIFRGREMDLSSHELLQAAQLLLKGNGNMLERLLGPCVVLRSPAGEELTALAKRTLSRRVLHHYRGFFERMITEHEKAKGPTSSSPPTAKRILYAYRVALTGAHLLATGSLITDVRELAPLYGFDVSALLEQKRTGEKAAVVDDAFFVVDQFVLRSLLEEKAKSSLLPEHPSDDTEKALDAFVVEARCSCR